MARLLMLSAGVAAGAAAVSGNMNGKYSVSSGARQDVPFNDDYASKGHEFFDVWCVHAPLFFGNACRLTDA